MTEELVLLNLIVSMMFIDWGENAKNTWMKVLFFFCALSSGVQFIIGALS